MKKELLQVSISHRETGETDAIVEGELTVRTAIEFVSKLKELTSCDSVNLHIKNIKALDIAGLQIVESFKKTFNHKGIRVAVISSLSGESLTLAERAALTKILE